MEPLTNQSFPPNLVYVPQGVISIRVVFDQKFYHVERLERLFGRERILEVITSPEPFFFPSLNYPTSFDVVIFILY